MKKLTIGLMIAAAAMMGATVFAQTSTTSPAVTAYINQLQLLRQLQQGMSGEDVATLQTYLAAHPDIYPEGQITGYYGALTAKAVARWQKQMGIAAVGRIGPKTLAKLNDDLRENSVGSEDHDGTSTPCAKIPPGHLIAPGYLKKHKGESQTIPTCQTLPPGIANKLHDRGQNDDNQGENDGNGTSTVPTLPAPVISQIYATSTASTTATITWSTNIPTTGKVWFGTTTPVSTASSSSATSSSYGGIYHTVSLSGLTASTTYYYIISAANILGTTTTTTQQSFMTR